MSEAKHIDRMEEIIGWLLHEASDELGSDIDGGNLHDMVCQPPFAEWKVTPTDKEEFGEWAKEHEYLVGHWDIMPGESYWVPTDLGNRLLTKYAKSRKKTEGS